MILLTSINLVLSQRVFTVTINIMFISLTPKYPTKPLIANGVHGLLVHVQRHVEVEAEQILDQSW